MLAWSALIAITLVLAVLLQALVASARIAPEPVALSAASALVAPGPVALSTACQAALAAGDNERDSSSRIHAAERLAPCPTEVSSDDCDVQTAPRIDPAARTAGKGETR